MTGPTPHVDRLADFLRRLAPADATAVRSYTPMTLAQKTANLRQALGGLEQGIANLPADAVAMARGVVQNGPGSLQTVGRGEVRYAPVQSMGQRFRPLLDAIISKTHENAQTTGDLIAGGAPQDVSQETFRDLGNVTGNMLGWTAASQPMVLGRFLANQGKTGYLGMLEDLKAARADLSGLPGLEFLAPPSPNARLYLNGKPFPSRPLVR